MWFLFPREGCLETWFDMFSRTSGTQQLLYPSLCEVVESQTLTSTRIGPFWSDNTWFNGTLNFLFYGLDSVARRTSSSLFTPKRLFTFAHSSHRVDTYTRSWACPPCLDPSGFWVMISQLLHLNSSATRKRSCFQRPYTQAG